MPSHNPRATLGDSLYSHRAVWTNFLNSPGVQSHCPRAIYNAALFRKNRSGI